MEGQKRNIVQLERIRAIVKQRWDLKKGPRDNREESENKEDRDKEEGSENGPGES